MIQDIKKLIGLPVKAEDGEHLGKLKDFQVEINSLRVVNLVVSHSLIGKNDLLINPSQVVKITEKEIIVKSGLVPIGGKVMDMAGI